MLKRLAALLAFPAAAVHAPAFAQQADQMIQQLLPTDAAPAPQSPPATSSTTINLASVTPEEVVNRLAISSSIARSIDSNTEDAGCVDEHYSWTKCVTGVSNLIIGRLTIEHYGDPSR